MLTRRHALTGLAATLALTPLAARAGLAPVYAEAGIAIDGSDPVAYFIESRPVAGDPAISLRWRGATWRFASVENRTAFEADPTAFAPQYGGYCAWAVSRNYTAPTVPSAWAIHDGRLYLNFSRGVQRRWARDIPGNVRRGDANWPGLLNA